MNPQGCQKVQYFICVSCCIKLLIEESIETKLFHYKLYLQQLVIFSGERVLQFTKVGYIRFSIFRKHIILILYMHRPLS
jgi:hypothetical protein